MTFHRNPRSEKPVQSVVIRLLMPDSGVTVWYWSVRQGWRQPSKKDYLGLPGGAVVKGAVLQRQLCHQSPGFAPRLWRNRPHNWPSVARVREGLIGRGVPVSSRTSDPCGGLGAVYAKPRWPGARCFLRRIGAAGFRVGCALC